jgi:glucose-6-phosphate isomerase
MQRTQMEEWKALEHIALNLSSRQAIHTTNPITNGDITLDYSNQLINAQAHELLFKLANECKLPSMIEALFLGKKVNLSENKPALHTALRCPEDTQIWIDEHNIIPDVIDTQKSMHEISKQIRLGEWRGHTNKAITDIINIGIGGSHLGPAFCIHALGNLALKSLDYHFISDIDEHAFTRITERLNPETTLFIISSKSFTTLETLNNMNKAVTWIGVSKSISQHFIAVTAYPQRAKDLGITCVLPMWEWVGGRYSLCSAINLITCIAIGFEHFSQLLHGAHEMDKHFRNTPFSHNLPVNLALLGIWNNNFLKIHQLLLLTYGYNLDYFASYIQQLDMESNGKSIDTSGRAINYATGPIVWGGAASQAQHSYYQLLCQGTHRISVDLISIDSNSNDSPVNQLCAAQKEILSKGSNNLDNPNAYIYGHLPINHLRLKDNTPRSLGALIALYEHKIYVQSIIWHINAFDQPGVESSKQLMKKGCSYA